MIWGAELRLTLCKYFVELFQEIQILLVNVLPPLFWINLVIFSLEQRQSGRRLYSTEKYKGIIYWFTCIRDR